MRATARLRVEAPCRLVEVAAEPPFAVRSDRSGTVWLVGAAAGPLGGDDLTLHVEVGPGAQVCIRSVAAQLVLPGTGGGPARVRIEATVEAGGHLDWAPEPTVVAAGADLRHTALVRLAAGGTLRWREVLVLGRHGEQPGRATTALRVDLADQPLLRHALAVPGPVAGVMAGPRDGPADLAGARAVASELVAGGGAGEISTVAGSCRGDRRVVMPLDGDGVLTMVAAADARTALAALGPRS